MVVDEQTWCFNFLLTQYSDARFDLDWGRAALFDDSSGELIHMAYYLGIDLGTSGVKSIIIDTKGNVIAEGNAEYPLYQPKPGWTEQDPNEWWQGVISSVRQALDRAKVPGSEIRSLGLSGQMHGSVFLDRQNKVVRKALLWNDQRTAAECDEITLKAGGRKALIKMVANPALTGFTAPKILWLRNKEPKNFAKTVKVLLPKDEIRRRLTGNSLRTLATPAAPFCSML